MKLARALLVALLAILGLQPVTLALARDASQAGPILTDAARTGSLRAAQPQAVPRTSRLAGADRYATSVRISRHRFADPSRASVVYLARGDVFADALAAGALTDGPVLLVPRCGGVPGGVITEIGRLRPDRVIALGRQAAVCDATLRAAADGRPTGRVGGADRAHTAVLIARRAFPNGVRRVYLAKGGSSPDAVVGGTLTDGPVLLVSTDGTRLPAVTDRALDDLGAATVVALGGTRAVSRSALTQAAQGRSSDRLAGSTRFDTALAVARHAFPRAVNRVYLARGDGSNYVDAVAAGVLTDGPVVLTAGPCDWVPSSVRRYLGNRGPTQVVALGGPSTLCDTVLRQAARAVSPPPAVDCGRVRCVALTFDDGPSAHTGRLLDILIRRNVPATFFVVGQQAAVRPQTTQRIAMEGFEVANHTYTHPEMDDLTRSQQLSQVARTDAVLRTRGVPRTQSLRPPYGLWDANTRTLGVPLILWSVDPRDWENRNTQTVRTHVRTHAHSGAIVLQHDTIGASVDAVPGIVSDLRALGYTFVTVEQLVPSAGPGDLVYSRGRVLDSSVQLGPSDVGDHLPGMPSGPVVDEAPAP